MTDLCSSDNGERFMDRVICPLNLSLWEYSTHAFGRWKGSEKQSEEMDDFLSDLEGYPVHDENLGVEEESSILPPRREQMYMVRPLMGMESFPQALWHNYSCVQGGRTTTNMELTSVTKTHSVEYPWRLEFVATITSPCTEITWTIGPRYTVEAERVVLALPRAALQRIQFFDESVHSPMQGDLQTKITELVQSIQGEPLMKMFAAYESRWWTDFAPPTAPDAKFRVGVYSSSLPTNQIIAWYPGNQQWYDQPTPCGPDMGVLQTYVTNNPVESWGGTTDYGVQAACKVADASKCSECFNETNGFWGNPAHHITETLMNTTRAYHAVLFDLPLPDVPFPTEMRYMIWDAQDPVTMSDGCHHWIAGVRWWEKYAEALEPDTSLHIVGEAFSFANRWGEGALETAETMLHEKMGMQLPPWLSRQDYCWAMPYYPSRRD